MCSKLDICPFCGGEVKARKSEFFKTPLMFFDCQKCGATVSFNDPVCNYAAYVGDYTPSITAFNKRASRTCADCYHEGLNSNDCNYCVRRPSLEDMWQEWVE